MGTFHTLQGGRSLTALEPSLQALYPKEKTHGCIEAKPFCNCELYMQELTCCDLLVLEGREWLPVFDMRWSGFRFSVPALRTAWNARFETDTRWYLEYLDHRKGSIG